MKIKKNALPMEFSHRVMGCNIELGTGSYAAAAVPGVMNFSGILTDLNGKPLLGIQGVTFLLYSAPEGGTPLWMETQNITPGKNGQYTMTLGATKSD